MTTDAPTPPTCCQQKHSVGLEAGAAQVRVFAAQVIPDLLQTREYAMAAWRIAWPGLTMSQADRLAGVTAYRQKTLGNDGHLLHAVIDEAALLRPLGSAQVMAAQIDHLAWVATASHVTVQVLPLATPWPALSTPFTLLSFGDASDSQTVCMVGADGQAVLTSQDKAVRIFRATFDALMRAFLSAAQSAHLITGLAKQHQLEPLPTGD